MAVDPTRTAGRRMRPRSREPLAALRREISSAPVAVISSDVFDTVLLRDSSTETRRLVTASSRAARRLGVPAKTLIRMRWISHEIAYRAVAMERPGGEASLAAMCRASVAGLGLDESAANVLHDAELATDVEHLRPNRRLLDLLAELRHGGTRVVATTDIYYSAADVERLLVQVTGENPFDAIYSSSDLGVTKLAGGIFAAVERAEGVAGGRIVHIGDSIASDVVNARTAGWRAVHAPRGRTQELLRVAARAKSLPLRMRRDR